MTKFKGDYNSPDNKTTRKMWWVNAGIELVKAVATAVGLGLAKSCIDKHKAKSDAKPAPTNESPEMPTALCDSTVYGQHKTSGIDDKPEFLVENIKRGGINFIGGPTGACKSVLAMQVLICISLGKRSIFQLTDNATSQYKGTKVFLYDRENGKDRLECRTCLNEYKPGIEVIHKSECTKLNTLDKLLTDIRLRVKSYGSDCVVCIDNLTRFVPTVNDQIADQLYNGLESIHDEMTVKGTTITFIVVCHTSKGENLDKGIDENNFRGSGNLVNFSDNSIAINYARGGKAYKYIKPIKERDCATDTVTMVQWSDSPIWHLEKIGEMREEDACEYLGKSANLSSTETTQQAGQKSGHGKYSPEVKAKIKELMALTPRPSDAEVVAELNKIGLGVCKRTWSNMKKELGYSRPRQEEGKAA